MNGLEIFGVFVGLDNLAVILGLGVLSLSKECRWWILCSFVFFETLMPLVGYMLGQQLLLEAGELGERFGAVLLAICGVFVVLGVMKNDKLSSFINRRWTMVLLGFLLSFDNLAAGAGFAVLGLPLWASVLMLGGISASMCVLGLMLGKKIQAWIPNHANLIGGIYMICLAILLVVIDN